VALLGTSACRSAPDVAAYVGDRAITEARVTELIDGLMAAMQSAGQNGQRPDRAQVVNLLVGNEVCERARAKTGFPVEPPQLEPGLDELRTIGQQTAACMQAMPIGKPAEPSEAEIREVFDAGVRLNMFEAGSFDQQRQQLLEGGQLADAVARRKVLAAAVADADVKINPKYHPMEFALLSWQQGPAFSLRLTRQSPVVDAPPKTEAPQQPPQ